MSDSAATPRHFALIPCAGSGSRALAPGAALPKQYMPIAGQSMVLHTLAAFAAVSRIAALLVVVAPGDQFLVRAGARCQVRDCGGASRADSVRNGLQALRALGAQEHDWVLVHDAARCLVQPAQIEALIDACADDAVGGLLAHRLPDTLKQDDGAGRVATTLSRADKWLAQTPQMFRIGLLARALDAALVANPAAVTDEASAVEAVGLAPRLVPGGALNFKVTYPEDFALAEQLLLGRAKGTT